MDYHFDLPKVSAHPVTTALNNVAKLQEIVRATDDMNLYFKATHYLDHLSNLFMHQARTDDEKFALALKYSGLHVTTAHTETAVFAYIGRDVREWTEFCLYHQYDTEIENRLFGTFTTSVTDGMRSVFPDVTEQKIAMGVMERNLVTATQMHLLGVNMLPTIDYLRSFLQTHWKERGHQSKFLTADLSKVGTQLLTSRVLVHGSHHTNPYLITRAIAHNHQVKLNAV